METENRKLSLNEFISQYVLDQKSDSRRYCYILGAGASKQSGIPTGKDLAKQWVIEIEQKLDKTTFENWKKDINYVEGYEAEKYSEIYEKRFEINPKEGYIFLEKIMEKIEPSFGYSVLAQILEKTQDKIVITTNFDNLIEDAMFIYARKRPLTLGHESLAGYMNLHTKRPIIAKIHRDLFLSPKNRNCEINELEQGWEENLVTILKYYTPIVVGYGGNDGSLMNFLESNKNLSTGMFWFYWEGNGNPKDYLPNTNIINTVNEYNGFIIPIKGFDEMMLQINEALGYQLLDDELIKIAENRTKTYQEKIRNLTSSDVDPAISGMLLNAIKKHKKNWWTVQIEIDNEVDINKKNDLFIQGIKEIQNSHELIGNYANFLKDIKKDYAKAEKYYKMAIGLDPSGAIYINNYANFLADIKKDYVEAENHYKKAIELDPSDASTIGNYANFLADIKKDYDEAENHYKKAIELDSSLVDIIGNYAKLKVESELYDEAEKLIDKAILLNANEENSVALELWFYRFAIFREWHDEAELVLEELLQKGVKSLYWDLNLVITKAEKLKHPKIQKVYDFNKRIVSE